VGHPQVWEELSLAVTGVVAGREVELTRTHEGGHGEGGHGEGAHEAGPHQHRYRFRVGTVKEAELPALDDELAKALGVDGVEKLTAEVESRLRGAKLADSRRRRERALLDQLVERHPMPLPEWVVENEIKLLLTEYAEELARQGVDVEKAAIDWSQLAEEARPQAARRVHSRLLLDAVADDKAIKLGEDELEATLAALARVQGRSAPVLRRELDEAGKLAPLRAQLRRERTIRFLLGEPVEGQGPAGHGVAGRIEPGAASGESTG
jgi:trigger factor